MDCSKCGANLVDDALFCDKCSTELLSVDSKTEQNIQKKSKGSGLILVTAVAIFALAFIGVFGSFLLLARSDWFEMETRDGQIAAFQAVDRIRIFQAQYAARNRGNYGTFPELVKTGLDDSFNGARPAVKGYTFEMIILPASDSRASFYTINADPVASEGIHYYTDSNIGTIKRTDENRPAKADDPAL